MSEYQYYEFLAIDRSLAAKEMDALRAVSGRARITPVSFSNEYNWGSFKGNPMELMRRFFDAHVYVANWGTSVFMVRLPLEALSQETACAMAVDDFLQFEATATHWLITWSLNETEDYDRFAMDEGEGWMARLVPVRDELLRGDLRSLYIGWLAAVTVLVLDDEDREPLTINGLANLTAAQQALAEFLEVDADLLAGAGIGSPEQEAGEPSPEQVDDWLGELPRAEVRALLRQLLDGQGLKAERLLRNRYSAWLRNLNGNRPEVALRTVAELWENAESAEKLRLDREKRQEEEAAAKRRQERDVFLRSLARDFPKAWKGIQRTVERGSGRAYDEACRALVELAEAYSVHASRMAFRQELGRFMTGNQRRKALVERLVRAGLWQDAAHG